MKCTMFPGQQEALARRVAEIRAEGRRQLSRRTILGVGLGSFFGVASGSLATLGVTAHAPAAEERNSSSRPAGEPSPELDWARQLAVGQLDELLDAQVEFACVMAQAREIDEVLWVGVMRLSNAVIDDHPGVEPALSGLLVPLAGRHDAPAGLRHMLLWIRDR